MHAASRLQAIRATDCEPAKVESEKFPKKQPRWMTEAVACSVHAERGTVKRIASALDVREGAVYEVADINDPADVKAWWLPTIVRETGSFAALDALEREVGRCAFELPQVTTPESADVVQHTAKVVQEFSDVLNRVSASIADGTITEAEQRAIEREAGDVHAALAALVEVGRRQVAA